MGRAAWRAVGAELATKWARHHVALTEAGFAGPDDYRLRAAGFRSPTVVRWIREGWRNA